MKVVDWFSTGVKGNTWIWAAKEVVAIGLSGTGLGGKSSIFMIALAIFVGLDSCMRLISGNCDVLEIELPRRV